MLVGRNSLSNSEVPITKLKCITGPVGNTADGRGEDAFCKCFLMLVLQQHE